MSDKKELEALLADVIALRDHLRKADNALEDVGCAYGTMRGFLDAKDMDNLMEDVSNAEGAAAALAMAALEINSDARRMRMAIAARKSEAKQIGGATL